ncbi:MAG: peptidoglycan-binding protein [Sphingomonadales bacterium]|nr:peptidoglycan-binding protein [Sphingomonadales bacterium]
MTARRLMTGLAVFAVLVGAAMVNILVLQPQRGKTGGSAATADSQTRDVKPATQPASQQTVSEPVATAISRPEVRQGVIRELYTRGYLSGSEADAGPLVVECAILAFEHDHGLPLTAEASDDVLQGLILGTAGGPPRVDAAPGPNATRVIDAVGRKLTRLGYPLPNGNTGRDLVAAIRNFERDTKLAETGRISASLMQAMNRAAAVKGLATTR